MIAWAWGTVTDCLGKVGGMQSVEVLLDAAPARQASGKGDYGFNVQALHDCRTTGMGMLARGDRVLLNRTAGRLGLGTGGYDFVVYAQAAANEQAGVDDLPRRASEPSGHIMKLRYTPLQRSLRAVEEQSSPHHAMFKRGLSLQGTPVLIGELHSMLPIACCVIRCASRESGREALPVAYVMTDGGALPLAISRHTAALRAGGWLNGTVTYGHAYGGDLEAVNKFTALLAARHVLKADIIVACMGPGITGTATPLGHSGMETGELINAVSALGGIPILMPRVSFADGRERHRGISHHLLNALAVAAQRPALLPLSSALPELEKQRIAAQLEAVRSLLKPHGIRWVNGPVLSEVEQCLALYPLDVTTMGRGVRDDSAFFLSVAAAARMAWMLSRHSGTLP